MNVNVQQLEAAVLELRAALKDGLVATDFFDRKTGLILAGFNQQPAAAALFTELTNVMSSTLSDSGFPGLGKYYFLDLEHNNCVILIKHSNDLLQGMLMDSKKVNLGILFAVAIPKMIAAAEKAMH